MLNFNKDKTIHNQFPGVSSVSSTTAFTGSFLQGLATLFPQQTPFVAQNLSEAEADRPSMHGL